MWSMMCNSGTGAAADWLHSQPGIPGVSHDGSNTVYPHTPPVELWGDYFEVTPDMDPPPLIEIVGRFLAAESGRLLVAPRDKLELLYALPHWRLWCSNYVDGVDDGQFAADKAEVGIPAEMTKEEAKIAVKSMFVGGGDAAG